MSRPVLIRGALVAVLVLVVLYLVMGHKKTADTTAPVAAAPAATAAVPASTPAAAGKPATGVVSTSTVYHASLAQAKASLKLAAAAVLSCEAATKNFALCSTAAQLPGTGLVIVPASATTPGPGQVVIKGKPKAVLITAGAAQGSKWVYARHGSGKTTIKCVATGATTC